MKKQLVVIAILLSCISIPAFAQVGVSVNLNVQPVWGPVGYDRADYYYMPDIETYYNVPRHEYTYFDGGRWVTTVGLPPRYSNYDLYHGYKVVINEPNPWFHHDRYRRQYIQYRGRHDQAVIRDSHDQRYFANPGHPHYQEWQRAHGGEHREGVRREEHREGERHEEHREERHEDHRDR